MAAESKPITVVTLDSEEAYFRRQDEEKLRALRDRAAKDAGETYAAAHRGHCFRCGTTSLAEVDHGKIKVDVCVNKGCGAVHLDPGELDALMADHTSVGRIRKALLACFK